VVTSPSAWGSYCKCPPVTLLQAATSTSMPSFSQGASTLVARTNTYSCTGTSVLVVTTAPFGPGSSARWNQRT
jgi:hypothetical protein